MNGEWMRCGSMAALVLLSGCDGATNDMDGGVIAADAATDAGSSALCGDTVCAEGAGCVNDVCLAPCSGVTAEELDEALGEGLTPIANFCGAGATAFAIEPEGTVLEVRGGPDGDTAVEVALYRWDPDAPLATVSELATHRSDVAAGTSLFTGGYLELTPARALYGYTTSAEGGAGEVLVTTLVDGTVTAFPAPSNFDGAWIDDARIVINGLGLGGTDEGQGLYVVDLDATPSGVAHAAIGPGDFSGSVAVTDEYVFAGGTEDGTFANLVFAIPRTELELAIDASDPIALDGTDDRAIAVVDPDGAPLAASTFTIAQGRLVVLPFSGEITSYVISEDGTATLSSPRVLGSAEIFRDVIDARDGTLLFVHAGGQMIVQP